MADAVLVYDDDCGFCTWWAEFVEDRSTVPLVGFSDLGPELRERLPDGYEACSHLVTPDRVFSCGESIEQALLRTDVGAPARPVVERLKRIGAYERAREWGYQRVARNRSFWGRFTSTTPPARRRGRDAEDR